MFLLMALASMKWYWPPIASLRLTRILLSMVSCGSVFAVVTQSSRCTVSQVLVKAGGGFCFLDLVAI